MAERGTALVLATLWVAGCSDIELPLDVQLVLPADDTELDRTNNVSLVIEPLGSTETVTTDGLDFALSVSLPPTVDRQTLSVFLAEDETLLAWGETPPVSLSGNTSTISLLLAKPETLSSFDADFDAPDPDALAAAVGDIGLLVLASDGTGVLLDVFTWALRSTEPIPSAGVLPPTDGVLVPDLRGGVQRIGTRDGLSIHRYDILDDAWSERAVDTTGAERFGLRPDAITARDVGDTGLFVIAGGEHTDVLRLDLAPDADVIVTDPGFAPLDDPRPGATATLVTRGEGELTSLVVFGATDDRPAAWLLQPGVAFGPVGPWTNAGCTMLDAPAVDVALRVLCVGGERAGAPTSDGVVLQIPPPGADEAPTATELPDLLTAPMNDPIVLPGLAAVYAQGSGHAVSIGRDDLVTEARPTVGRASGGHTATLALGPTFLVGGLSPEGAPLARWLVFTPQPG